MGKLFDALDGDVRRFIESQHLFFVATAPTDLGAHLNVSPKGLDGLRVLGPRLVAYVDYPGSGVETIAHLRDNGRITLLFCAFDGPPKIVRLYGRGRVVEPPDSEFASLLAHFEPRLEPRAIIAVDVERIADSCGYGVPLYEYLGERDQLPRWARAKGPEAIASYQSKHNAASLDGLPGLRWVAAPPDLPFPPRA